MGKRVLIVDDEQDIVKVLSMRLKINQFTVLTASDGEMGLETARREKPDLILLDLMLPKMNGFEVCRLLKFDDATKNIPIIVLSALNEQVDRDKVTQSGADAYFLKPFDFVSLLSKIKSLAGV